MRRGWGRCTRMWGHGDRGPDGAPRWRQACSPLNVSVRVSLSPPLHSPFSLSSRGLNGWILLHLYPGQRLLLGRNKSWGFLLSQLSGGGTWKEGWEDQERLRTRPGLQGSPGLLATDPMQVPGPPRATVLPAAGRCEEGAQGTGSNPELSGRAVSRGTVAPWWGSL